MIFCGNLLIVGFLMMYTGRSFFIIDYVLFILLPQLCVLYALISRVKDVCVDNNAVPDSFISFHDGTEFQDLGVKLNTGVYLMSVIVDEKEPYLFHVFISCDDYGTRSMHYKAHRSSETRDCRHYIAMKFDEESRNVSLLITTDCMTVTRITALS